MQKVRRHTRGCSDHLSARGFRYYFTPLQGCFSPFPHGTSSLSVTREYLALEGGPPGFGPRFTGAVLLRDSIGRPVRFRLRDDCPLWCAVPRASTNTWLGNCRRIGHDPVTSPTTPDRQRVPAYTCPV